MECCQCEDELEQENPESYEYDYMGNLWCKDCMSKASGEERCPKCGNENLKRYEQIAVGRIVSAKTGRVLKNQGHLEMSCWNLFCKCGWEQELQVP